MPFPFVPSTTSHLTFQGNFSSATHPSLPASTTSLRNVFRAELKSYKRLSKADQAGSLSNILASLLEYLKYLNTVSTSLSGIAVSGEEIDLALAKEVEVEWRPTLAASAVPGRELDRVKGRGLDYEIYFVHHTCATLHNLIARHALLGLYASSSPSNEQRLAIVQNATRSLRTTYSLHAYLVNLSRSSSDEPASFPPGAVDIADTTQYALQRLAAAEINLLAVLKDDPYPALLIQSRNDSDKEWMIKAPTIPKVRAQVLTRLCVGASEHAAAARASLKAQDRRVSKDLIDYTDDLRRTARARAARFQALDSDLAGQTGQAIAWLYAAQNELGVEVSLKEGSSRVSKLDKLKSSWNERREDKKIAKADPRWGADGGKSEESRILEYLEKKFTKTNNTINIQVIPDWRPLLASLPSGMNLPLEDKWKDVFLEEAELIQVRAPPEEFEMPGASSGEEEAYETKAKAGVVGAFPGTKDEHERSGSSYY